MTPTPVNDFGGAELRAITLWQPWASAMALRLKYNETRSWPTKYRGDIVICSAQRPLTGLDHEQELMNDILARTPTLPFGCALCVARITGCGPAEDYHPSDSERRWGDYTHGRFVWVTSLSQFTVLKPIPVRGRQGIWRLSEAEHAAVMEQLI